MPIRRSSVGRALVVLSFTFAARSAGTFIFDNEKEKKKYDGVKRTVSLWSYFNRPEILHTFLNPFYEPNQNVLWPSVAAPSIVSVC